MYDETENLSNKFVTLQTKKKCQFFSNSQIVDKSIKENTRNESINSNIESITSNALSLIIQERIRFSFDLKDVFSMTRRKVSNKRSKDRSFKSKKLFEKSNDSFRLEIKKQVVLFEIINKMIQKNETFVNVSLSILIVVKIMQEIDYFARQQRVKLLSSQIMKKRLNNDVSAKANQDQSQFLLRKIDENSRVIVEKENGKRISSLPP